MTTTPKRPDEILVLVTRVAEEMLPLPNRKAWEAMLESLREAGVAKHRLGSFRELSWGQRKRLLEERRQQTPSTQKETEL